MSLLLALTLAQVVHRINNIQTVTGDTTGSSVQVLGPDSDRSYLMCQADADNTTPVLVDFGRAAGAGSIQLLPGGSVTFAARAVPTSSVTIGGTAGSGYTCKSGGN